MATQIACLMELRAEHFDGFTEHHVSWVLVASQNTAIIEASWHDRGGGRKRTERVFEMDFPNARIEACAAVLATLRPLYNGHVDDFPQFSLSVTNGDVKMATKVLAGINWPSEDKVALESFMRVWRPLSSDVERLLAIPGRSDRKRK